MGKRFYEESAVAISNMPTEGEGAMPEEMWLDARQGKFDTLPLSDEFTEFLKERTMPTYTVTASEAAAVNGTSPWVCSLDLFNQKRNVDSAIEEKKNVAIFKRGHAFESAILSLVEDEITEYLPMIVSSLSGGGTFTDGELELWTDKRIFMSRNETHMMANPDGFCVVKAKDEKGKEVSFNGYVEVKTLSSHSYDAQSAWKDGLVPPAYETQCIHSMAVYGADFSLIICAWGLDENERMWNIIPRNKEKEEKLIEQEKQFVSDLAFGVEPDAVISPLLENAYYARLYGKTRDETLILPETSKDAVLDLAKLDEEITEAEKALESLNLKREAAIAKLYPVVKDAERAVMELDGRTYAVDTKMSMGRASYDYERMATEDKDLYAEVVDETITRKLNRKAKLKDFAEKVQAYHVEGKPTGERKWKLTVKDKDGNTKTSVATKVAAS